MMRGVLAAAVLAVCLADGAAAQIRRSAPPVSEGERIAREWAIRGLVDAAAGPSAVLEHLPSGREELVRAGATLSDGAAVVTIDAERVILNATDGTAVTLRLGHGGQAGSVRRPAPPARRVPLPIRGRR
jgi:hypothetical protein